MDLNQKIVVTGIKGKKEDYKVIEVLEKLRPILLEFSVSEKMIKKELEDNGGLCITLNQLFSINLPEKVERWILIPFKIYNNDFANKVLSLVSEDVHSIPDASFSASFVENMIIEKRRIYEQNQEKMVSSDVFSHDYLERLVFMMLSLNHIKYVTEAYECYYLDRSASLEYVTRRFPCSEFVRSLNFESDPSSFMRKYYDVLLNSNVKFLDQFVMKNIENNNVNSPTFQVDDIEVLVPAYQTETQISCENFRSLLNFVLRNEELVGEKIELFPLLKSFYEDKRFDHCSIDSFLQAFNAAPESFFYFLVDEIEEDQVANLFGDEIRNLSHLFSRLSHLPSEKQEKVYPLLITPQYLSLSSDRRKKLLEYMNFYNLETIQCLNEEFDNVLIDFDLVSELHFNKFLSFLVSDNKKEFDNKMLAIHTVSHQLDASHFNDYLSYLEYSHLAKKSEYKAHSAYFKNHSIDKFFDSFVLESWKSDVLHTKTDDKRKKKQQLKCVKKVPVSRLDSLEIRDNVMNTLQYSNDISQIKDMVQLIADPLFDELDSAKQLDLLSRISLRTFNIPISIDDDSFEIVVPKSSLEELPDKGFVKCKGIGKNGVPIEFLVGRGKNNYCK